MVVAQEASFLSFPVYDRHLPYSAPFFLNTSVKSYLTYI